MQFIPFSPYTKGVIYALASAFFYGIMGLFSTKLYSYHISTDAMLFWRFSIACLLIILFSPKTLSNLIQYTQKEYYRLFLVSFICFTGSSWLYFEATKLIGTGLAITVFFCFPLFVILYSFFIDKVKISKDVIISLIILILGLLLINDAPVASRFSANHHYGILISAISGFFYASYLFFSKKLSPNVKGLNGTFIVCLGNMLACLTLAIVQKNSLIFNLTLEISWNIFCIAFLCTILPIFFLVKSLKTLSATKVAILTMVEPLTTIIIGIMILHEPINSSKVIGMILILASSLVISLSKKNK